ncbi:MAG: hypothetical protein ACRD4Q_03255, partial [Candidatus Acidiferrales bacterium]
VVKTGGQRPPLQRRTPLSYDATYHSGFDKAKGLCGVAAVVPGTAAVPPVRSSKDRRPEAAATARPGNFTQGG